MDDAVIEQRSEIVNGWWTKGPLGGWTAKLWEQTVTNGCGWVDLACGSGGYDAGTVA